MTLRLPLRLLLLIFLISVILGGLLYWVGTRTGILEQQVNAWLDSFLSAQLPLVVTVEDIGGEVWHHLQLTGIRLDEIRADTLVPLLAVDTLAVDYSWRDLLSRRWKIRGLTLAGVRGALHEDADGQLRKPWQPETAAAERQFTRPELAIDSLRLRRVEVVRLGSDTLRVNLDSAQGRLILGTRRMAATASARGLAVTGPHSSRVDTLHAQVIIVDGRWFAEQLYIRTDSTTLTGSARSDSSAENEIFAQINLAPARWNDFTQWLAVDLPGHGDLAAEVRYGNGRAQGRGTLKGTFFDRHIDGLGFSFRVADKRVQLDTLFGRALRAHLEGTGYLDLSTPTVAYGVKARIDGFNLSELVLNVMSSDLSGEFDVEGQGVRSKDLRVEIRTPGGYGRLDKQVLDSFQGTLMVTTDTLLLHTGFRASYLGMDATLSGTVAFSDDMYFAGTVDVPSVTRVIDYLDFPGADGHASGRFVVRGPTTDPDLAFALRVDSLSYLGATAPAAAVRADLKRAFTAARGSVRFRVQGPDLWGVPADSGATIVHVTPERIRFDSLALYRQGDSLRTLVDFAPDSRALTVRTLSASVLGQPVDLPWPAEFGVGRDTLWVHNFSLLQDSGSLTLNGWIEYDGAWDLELVTANAAVGPWMNLVLPHDALEGTLFADVAIAATRDDPQIDYRLRLRDATYNGFRFGDVTSCGRLEKSRARVDSLTLRSGTANYVGRGTIPLLFDEAGWRPDPDGPIEGHIAIDGGGVRLASFFLPDVESLTGSASGTVDIGGSLESPQLEGRFQLKEADLKVWQLRDHLTPVDIEVVLHDSVASIVKAHAVARAEGYEGDITATGDLVFKDLSTIEYSLQIRGRNVPARYEFADFVGRFDIDLTVTESNPPLLQGTAFVHEAYYRDPFEYSDSLSRLAAQVQIDTTAWNLYVDARIPKNAWTKNRDVNAEWSGEVRIIRQRGQWNYLGRLEPLRGSYYFFGKRFRNLRGEIIFDDIHQVDPRLNLEADVNLAMGVDTQSVSGTQGLSYRDVTVKVEGRLSEPRIVPPAWLGEHNFIVALNPLGNPEAHGDRNWAESAALGAAGILAGELERLGTRTLGVETFELRPNERGRYDLEDAHLRIGTYLLPDIYVYGSSGFDVTKGTEVGFEYRLRNWLTVQGNRNFENLYKFDLKLKWEMDK